MAYGYRQMRRNPALGFPFGGSEARTAWMEDLETLREISQDPDHIELVRETCQYLSEVGIPELQKGIFSLMDGRGGNAPDLIVDAFGVLEIGRFLAEELQEKLETGAAAELRQSLPPRISALEQGLRRGSA